MTHPLVEQFRFTRSEWMRGLQGVSEEDGARHFGPMNCIRSKRKRLTILSDQSLK